MTSGAQTTKKKQIKNKFYVDGYGIGLWTIIEETKDHGIWLLQRSEDFQSFFWWDIDLLNLTRIDSDGEIMI